MQRTGNNGNGKNYKCKKGKLTHHLGRIVPENNECQLEFPPENQPIFLLVQPEPSVHPLLDAIGHSYLLGH